MYIPFGLREPHEKEKALLVKLGFDLDEIRIKGRHYYLQMPTSMRYQKERVGYDKNITRIFYNDIEVITINQKTAIYDSFVYFHLHETAINEALTKSLDAEADEPAEESSVKSDFQMKLVNRLAQVQFIVYGGGAERGFSKHLNEQLYLLQKLRDENPKEHDELIASNQEYQTLFEIFPGWTDKHDLQNQYAAKGKAAYSSIMQEILAPRPRF